MMKKVLTIFIFFILSFLIQALAQDNLLQNPGFETRGIKGFLDADRWNEWNAERLNEYQRNGNFSMHGWGRDLTGDGGAWQGLYIVPGSTYVFTGYLMSPSQGGFRKSPLADGAEAYLEIEWLHGIKNLGSLKSKSLTDASDGELFSVTGIAPENADSARFEVKIKSVPGSSGDVYFDDLKVEGKVPSIEKNYPDEESWHIDYGIEKNYLVAIRTVDMIPTSVYDLLEKKNFSVINIIFENKLDKPAKFKVNYQIEGKTAREEFVKLEGKSVKEVNYYPSLLPETISKITVHTPGIIIVKVFLIDESNNPVSISEKTVKTILSPYDQFCLETIDARGNKFDMMATLVSWITYNDRKLNEILSKATEKGSKLVPQVKIVGTQPPYIFTRLIDDKRTLEEKDKDCTEQIKLIYETMKNDYGLTYLNQPVVYKSCQRIKFPAITIKEKGNCIELSVLFASLLESIEIEPILALFLQDGHAAVGWKISKDDEEIFHLIEPNVFGENFNRLVEKGNELIVANKIEKEFKQGIPFPEDGIYKKNQNVILLDIKKIRNRIPPSPYVPQ